LLVDIVNQDDPADTYVSLSRNKRIDGLILSDTRVDDHALYDLLTSDFPIVLLGRLPGVQVSSVEFDNRRGAQTAVDHLVSQGHRRIGFIGYAPVYFTGVNERLNGYRDALAAAGIPFDERIVCFGDFNDTGAGFAAATRLLELSVPPTAIFVSSDVLAFPTLTAIHQHGLRIPDDIAVVGFDDNPLSRYAFPPLTSVYLPFEEMGRRAGEMLLHRLLHPDEPKHEILLDGQLIVRESSSRRL
jgi:LacI family transcriptional regulator